MALGDDLEKANDEIQKFKEEIGVLDNHLISLGASIKSQISDKIKDVDEFSKTLHTYYTEMHQNIKTDVSNKIIEFTDICLLLQNTKVFINELKQHYGKKKTAEVENKLKNNVIEREHKDIKSKKNNNNLNNNNLKNNKTKKNSIPKMMKQVNL